MLDIALSEYEFEYVMWTAEYTAINCKQSIKKYLGDALENNWAEEFIAEKKLKETRKKEKTEEKQLKLTLVNEENEKNKELEEEFLNIWKLYEEKSSKEKSEIETKAYEEFLKDIGQFDTKLNRAIFEKTKKNHIVKVIEKMTQYNEEIIKSEKGKNEFSLVKVYESLSMFLLEVMKVLEENDIKDFQKIVQIIPVLSEFKGTIGDKKINIKYNEGLESIININTTH